MKRDAVAGGDARRQAPTGPRAARRRRPAGRVRALPRRSSPPDAGASAKSDKSRRERIDRRARDRRRRVGALQRPAGRQHHEDRRDRHAPSTAPTKPQPGRRYCRRRLAPRQPFEPADAAVAQYLAARADAAKIRRVTDRRHDPGLDRLERGAAALRRRGEQDERAEQDQRRIVVRADSAAATPSAYHDRAGAASRRCH